jgi:uncharacterized membrane protein
MPASFIIACIIFGITIMVAIATELSRQTYVAPSMVPCDFAGIMIAGTIISLLVASTHFLSYVRW